MRILIVGAGVIGTVYGAQLGAAGHTVSVLRHPPRTGDIANRGLAARDVLTGSRVETRIHVVPDATGRYDLVLAAVRSDQLALACAQLTELGQCAHPPGNCALPPMPGMLNQRCGLSVTR
jgi:ketopantoate reductase